MKILGFSTSYPLGPDDGTAPFIRHISTGLTARGHTLTLVLPHHPAMAWPHSDAGVDLRRARYAPHPAMNVFGYGAAMRADMSLSWVAAAATPLAAGSMALSGRRASRRRPPDVLHAHWLVPGGPIAMVSDVGRNTPLVCSVHGSDVFMAQSSAWARRAALMASRRASALTVCSGDLARRLAEIGVPPAKMEVIPYGVDTQAFAPPPGVDRTALKEAFGLGPEPLVVAVGRLVAKKGFDVAIRGFARGELRQGEATFAIAGAGDLRDDLEAVVREHGLEDRVRFLGSLGRSDVTRLYWAADVVVVPSVVDSAGNVDGLPNVLMEALAAGAPVVASDVAGIPDVVASGVNGLLVPPGDPDALAAALGEVLRGDEVRTSLGVNAREIAVAEHDWSVTAARYEAVLAGAAGA